ncbi:MAG: hemerythrin domain-containing protein [Bacteroidales bacterium]|nr:hemerythrin domain-containing protein [Bacteroidales bacterium]
MDKIFSPKMKLADLIEANHNLILMLPRVGIPLGFGDKSVAEVCEAYHISEKFFLLICNVYTFNNYLPDVKEMAAIDMSHFVPYLMASHNFYLKERIPHIEKHLYHIAGKAEEKYGDILKKFFEDYKKEVEEHFTYEEQYVFPHLKALQEGKSDHSYKIAKFVQSHSNIEDKLSDLTQIIYKYLPGNILPEESIELVFDILQLSVDLEKHTLIEDKILVPYVEILERSLV